jgi:translation initiation factor RLI1
MAAHIEIINEDRCEPKKRRQEYKKTCPVVKAGEDPALPTSV